MATILTYTDAVEAAPFTRRLVALMRVIMRRNAGDAAANADKAEADRRRKEGPYGLAVLDSRRVLLVDFA